MRALDWVYANRVALLPQASVTLFEQYAAQVRASATGDTRTVTYCFASSGGGRIYADGSLSLASFSKPLRATLGASLYHDIDMENTHPRIMLYFARKHGWKHSSLRRYIEFRDAVLGELKCERTIAKQIFLALLMGGSSKSVTERRAVAPVELSKFARAFKQELKELASNIYRNYPKYHELVHRTHEPDSHMANFSALSYLLQECETTALTEACRFFESKGWRVGVLIHDGFLVYKRNDAQVDDELLRGASQHVRERCQGVEIPFVLKQFPDPLPGFPFIVDDATAATATATD